jgi:hypothetical protein
MRLFRAFGVRLILGVVVLSVMAVGWAVTSVKRSMARGDAQQTVSWFYDDARFSSFPAFVSASKDYLDERERSDGHDLANAFSTLDRKDFCNEFEDDGTLCPDELGFKANQIKQQDNDGVTAHMLVQGRVLPQEMERGKTKYSFSDDTYESFTHLVTLHKQGGSWYIVKVTPQN